jgi:hypothetical protein
VAKEGIIHLYPSWKLNPQVLDKFAEQKTQEAITFTLQSCYFPMTTPTFQIRLNENWERT